jgi:hypothetical protein
MSVDDDLVELGVTRSLCQIDEYTDVLFLHTQYEDLDSTTGSLSAGIKADRHIKKSNPGGKC